jgi:hypothetical protein
VLQNPAAVQTTQYWTLRSSPILEGRCCIRRLLTVHEIRDLIAILTDPGRPVLRLAASSVSLA